VRITRLYLRNYRVYEDELELEIPAGLVGIYGPNGAGKSYLIDSIRWSLYGRSRTSVDDVRSTGVGGECVTEVEFEHESHLYLVRRTITGVNHTVKAEAHWNGQLVAEGSRDVATYVQSVLGMDDASFRASVFAEQKQVAAFSDQTPQKRRDLVLRLLGITPLDKAREAARADAKAARADHERLQARLPDLGELAERAAAAEAAAVAAEEQAAAEVAVADAARKAVEEADATFERLDDLRRSHDDLVADGRAVREALDSAVEQVARSEAELADLAGAAGRLATLRPLADELPAMEQRLRAVEAVAEAEAALARIPPVEAPPPPDDAAATAARQAARQAADAAADLKGRLSAAEAALARAQKVVTSTEALEDAADCPVCGQELGASFERVQEHRAREVAEAEEEVARLRRSHTAAATDARTRQAEQDAAEAALADSRKAWSAHEVAAQRRASVEERLADARERAGRPPAAGEIDGLRAELPERRRVAEEAQRLAGRLERRPTVEAELRTASERVEAAQARRAALLEKVAGLGFKADDLAAARAARDDARRASRRADEAASHARVAAVQARATSEAAADLLQRGRDDHASIADLAETSRHVGRLADLLSDFRNQVVQTVGPRLATQAAELFGELTDHEYDRLEVDPETYDIQIRDAGRLHRMDRFSGSETDLANLALRVAISEHVRFQSGGAVGLLVLDEVFGPLDGDRKERMLLALERLRGRFRQVLVVTHDAEIKEQLPSAIEVVKLPGRRATARVLAGV
jgi:DNA repair protein SbcC/Rad50